MGSNEDKVDASEVVDLAELEKVSGTDNSYINEDFTDKSRDSYRLPAQEDDAIAVTVDGENHEMLDIGSRGLGIYLTRGDALKVDDSVHNIVLELNGEKLQLAGRVVHISGDGADKFLCGIELVDMDEKTEQTLLTFVQDRRKNAFE